MNRAMFKKLNKGFTLIELLVVIAIIGILVAMVLTNLASARRKAAEASGIGSLSSARAELENYYDSNGNAYTGGCTQGTYYPSTAGGNPAAPNGVELLMIAAANRLGDVTCDTSTAPSGQWYLSSVPLLINPAQTFCIDSTGFAGKVQTSAVTTVDSSGATVCNRP